MSLKLLLLCAILATVSCLKLTDDILLGNVPIGGPLKKAEPHAALLDDLVCIRLFLFAFGLIFLVF